MHAPAFDVMDVGRMAVIQDPQGAFFMVWEPKQHIGASVVNAAGALSWNELATPDIDASANFYGELFGWKYETFEGMPMPYMVIQTADGNSNGGLRGAMENEPTYWLVYFGTDDIENGWPAPPNSAPPPWSARPTSGRARSACSRTPRAPSSPCTPASSTNDLRIPTSRRVSAATASRVVLISRMVLAFARAIDLSWLSPLSKSSNPRARRTTSTSVGWGDS